MAVFLDANILFSGSNSMSNLRRLLNWMLDKEELATSHYAVAEAERNILSKRPQWQASYQELMRHIRMVPDVPLKIEAGLPDKDKPILGAAIAAGCEYLLTGDKRDFGHLFGKQIEGVTVISVLELAEILLNKHA